MNTKRPKKREKEYVEGPKALENFDKTMKTLFRAPKPKKGKD